MGSLGRRADDRFAISKICIIGAGSSGLSACKFLREEKAFSQIDVFECMEDVGGAWNYSSVTSSEPFTAPQTDPHVPLSSPELSDGHVIFPTPMYDTLRTNIPKMVMQYAGVPFPDDTELFPPRQVVQQYLVDYSAAIRSHIKFSTQVRDVRLVKVGSRDTWSVTTRDLKTGIEVNAIYDAVVVANGHYTVPYIAPVEGLEAWSKAYPGAVEHSKSYKSPEAYAAKKVVVVGNAASGADIGSQIVKFSQQPMLWSIRTPSDAFAHDERLEVGEIVEFILKDRAVRFADGRVEKNIDVVLFCTGFLYSFPFMESIQPPLVTDGRRVRGLYKQLFHSAHPTLAFPLLCQKVLPFPVSEFQAAAVGRVWSGRIRLPERQEMEGEEKREVAEKGDGTSYHVLMPRDVDYVQELFDWINTAGPGGKSVTMWDSEFQWIRGNFVSIRLDYANRVGVTTLKELGWDYESHMKN